MEPILITTPVTLEYKEKIGEVFLNDFYDKMDIERKTGVKYYDYSSDARFVHCCHFFMNADHLNCNGALEFTNILEREIINRKVH